MNNPQQWIEQHYDSPFDPLRSNEVFSVIQFYSNNVKDSPEDLEQFEKYFLDRSECDGAANVLVDLGEARGGFQSDLNVLVDKAVLLNLIAEWRAIRSPDPDNAYGRRNFFLDMPLEVWVENAYRILNTYIATTNHTIEKLISQLSSSIDITTLEPPEHYSAIEKLLHPFRAEFRTPIPEVVNILSARKGLIIMASPFVWRGSLLLKHVRQGLGIDPKELKKVQLQFVDSIRERTRDQFSWFDKRDLVNNHVNVAREIGSNSSIVHELEQKYVDLKEKLSQATKATRME